MRAMSKRKQITLVDEATVEEVNHFVKKQRTLVVTAEEKLDILLFQARIRF